MRLFALVLALSFLAFGLPRAATAQDIATVNFAFDSDVLDTQAQAQLKTVAENLRASGNYRPTVVIGYTDAVGSAGYNQGLGMRRARAVANALVADGVPVSRIGTVESRGERELLVRVSGPERANRRVTVTLEQMLAACRSWRDVGLTPASVGPMLQSDLDARLNEAVAYHDQLAASGRNGAAFQMAAAARADCGTAVGFGGTLRKVEYAQRCFCSSARMRVALND
ncbi:OmpA family protein [Tropicimonas sp.]|uniref:OmpA family protein n=1 Tax=Tropicimonas sp. TaxID=2067044 RepID=UPI003A88532C